MLLVGVTLMVKKWKKATTAHSLACGALVTYIFLVIAATLLSRVVAAQAKYSLQMFWSFYDYWTGASTKMLLQIIMNVVMFVPIGFLMPCVIRDFKYRKTAGFALCFTIFIEVTQLLTHRGFFEFDDIINNFLGACIGMLLYIWLLEKNRRYAKRMLLFIVLYMLGYGAILLTLHTLWLRDSAAAKEEMEAVAAAAAGEQAGDTEDSGADSKQASEDAGEEYVSPIDFEALWEQNPDIIGWIRVPGTLVDYPILRSPKELDTDYYLNHNLDGSAGYPGCIYMQQCNQADFSDLVTVLYGHNMKDSSMFSTLHRFENASFWEENNTIEIYTPEAEYVYQVYLCRDFDDRLIPEHYEFFKYDRDMLAFQYDLTHVEEGLSNASLIDTDVEVEDDAQQIVLSTCTGNSSQRWIVVGVRME